MWRKLITLYEASAESAKEKQAETSADSLLTVFGALPKQAENELGEQFGAVKQLERGNIDKQRENIQGNS